MNIILCLDNNNTNQFNNRRQSRDEEVILDMYNSYKGNLVVSEYSSKLFSEDMLNDIKTDNDLLENSTDEYCFVEEEISLSKYLDKTDNIIVYRWNRDYPFDKSLDINLDDFEKTIESEFAGKSHEQITKEIYKVK